MDLFLGSHKTSRSLHLFTRILKVYIEALARFSHEYHSDGLNNILLLQSCFVENSYHRRNGGQEVQSKDRGESKEPQIARVKLEGQLMVTSS